MNLNYSSQHILAVLIGLPIAAAIGVVVMSVKRTRRNEIVIAALVISFVAIAVPLGWRIYSASPKPTKDDWALFVYAAAVLFMYGQRLWRGGPKIDPKHSNAPSPSEPSEAGERLGSMLKFALIAIVPFILILAVLLLVLGFL